MKIVAKMAIAMRKDDDHEKKKKEKKKKKEGEEEEDVLQVASLRLPSRAMV